MSDERTPLGAQDRGEPGPGSPPHWDAVLFDLDGTLADTVELILRCFRHTMEVHRGSAPPDEEWLVGIGTPLRDQLRVFAADEAEVERMAATYSAFQRTIHDGMVEAYPEALELVRALRDRDVPVAIVTSKRRGMAERTLDRCGFGELYQVLVGADDVTRGKPDPEPVHLALTRLGLGREGLGRLESGRGEPDGASAGSAGLNGGRVVFVGDSPYDLRAGRGAGVRTAAALWGPFDPALLHAESPDYLLESPLALLHVEP